MLEPGHKNVTVDAALNNPIGLELLTRQGCEEREVAATVSGHAATSTLASGRTRMGASHRGVRSCFIDKDKLLRVKPGDFLPPRRSRFGILLARR